MTTLAPDELLLGIAALVGLWLHLRSLHRLWGPLPDPRKYPDERDVVIMFRVSDGVRLLGKLVMLIGAIYAATQYHPVMEADHEVYQFLAWRWGLVLLAIALGFETWWQGHRRDRLRRRWQTERRVSPYTEPDATHY